MTESTWAALRKPFAREQVGRLPATAKRPALDYVGHAAVTDRLNQVTPDWTYTIDERWTEQRTYVDRNGVSQVEMVVWLRGTLTIDGVSRTDYGDGSDPKEAIGNLLRRTAMRFGVAIDLWSREELDTSGAVAGGLNPTQDPAPDTRSGEGTAGLGAAGALSASSPGTTSADGEAAATEPEEGRPQDAPKPSSGSTKDAPGPPHYPLRPDECDHLGKSGHILRPRKSPRGPVCPRCGLSYITVTEGTNADLGAA